MTPMQLFETPFGPLTLNRYPLQKRETLQAWDAADEYLLRQLPDLAGSRMLILNDSFGALSCALAEFKPEMQSDSYIAAWSTRENLRNNRIANESVRILSSMDTLDGQYDTVLVRVTKTLALLEHQLIQLKPHLKEGCRVIGCGMVKQIHRSTLELFERIIGPTHTSLARKKARLIFSESDLKLPLAVSPYPNYYPLDGTPYTLCNHANLFSGRKLDIGTRFFIQSLPEEKRYRDIVDLGCGNGAVGLVAGMKNPGANLHFIDESYMAVASAESSFRQSGLENSASFQVGDCLSDFPEQSADLVLCNPPFHQQQVVGDAIAWRMFSQSTKVLRPGGELWIVGNRQLNYHTKLKRLFGNREQVAANQKFVISKSRKVK